MIYGSYEASIEDFIEINDEVDAKSWLIKYLFSGNKVSKHALSNLIKISHRAKIFKGSRSLRFNAKKGKSTAIKTETLFGLRICIIFERVRRMICMDVENMHCDYLYILENELKHGKTTTSQFIPK